MATAKTKAQLELELQRLQTQVADLQNQLADAQRGEPLRQLLDILPVGISILDHENKVIFENAALLQMLGLNMTQLRAGEYHKRSYLAQDGTPMPPNGFASAQARQTGQPVHDVETGIIKEDGETVWLNVSAIPVNFPDWKTVVVSREITERKRAEAQLQKLAERLNLATQAAHMGIWDWEIQKNEVVWDEHMYALFGLKPGDVSSPQEAFLRGIHPEDQETRNQALIAAARGEGEYNPVFRVVWPDGSVHWLKAEGRVFQDQQGQPVRMVTINYEITERRQIELALQQSEQKYAVLFEKSAVPTALTKMPEAIFADVNEAFQAIYGYSREEVMGKTSLEIGLKRAEERDRSASQFETYQHLQDNETQLFTKAGELRIGLVNASRVTIDQQEYVITTIHDVTERKQAETALWQSQANFAGAFEANPAGLAITRRVDGKFMLINSAYTAIMGYAPSEIVGQSVTDFSIYVDPDERKQVLQQMSEHGFVHNYELAVRSRNGTVREILVSMQPIIFNNEDCILAAFIDITERKQAEQAIRDQAERLREQAELLEHAHVLVHDMQGRIVLWNSGMQKLYGWSKDEALGQVTHTFFKTEFPHSFETFENELLQQGSWEGELTHVRKDGRKIVVASHQALYRDADGKPLLILEVNNDITELKQTELALKRSEESFAIAFDLNPTALVISSAADGTIVRVNQVYVDMMGYAAKDVLGRKVAELDIYVDTNERKKILARLSRDQIIRSYALALRTQSGRIVHTLLYMEPIRFAGQDCLISALIDTTEIRKLEENIHLNEERLRLALHASHQGLYDLNVRTGETIVNDEYALMLGYDPATFHETHRFWMQRLHPDDHENAVQIYQDYAAGKLPEYRAEFRQRMQNGDWKWILSVGKILEKDAQGNPVRMLGTHTDMDERKRMEEELRRSNAELEQFAYVASHDLQEPLRAIAGMVHLLRQKYEGQLDERADEYIDHTIEAAGRMQAMINDLLLYSRVERRNKPIEPVSAAGCLQLALKNLDVLIQETGAVVTVDELPVVGADPTQLIQLFQNLISNGIKFRGERPPEIRISISQTPEAWQFAVRDNGIGIEAEYFERIFQVFQRLHTRREYAGTGIGLAICKKIVERHGGRIWVESKPDLGSTFYFTLPLRSTYHEQPPTQTH